MGMILIIIKQHIYVYAYRLQIDNRIFLCSLVDLPCIIEGQKTLDFKTFYKSTDVSQLLFIHNKCIEDTDQKQPDDIIKIAKEFNPLEDQEFF